VFYLIIGGWSSTLNAVVLLVFVGLVFIPIRYVYPSRTPVLRIFTNVFGSIWSVLMLLMLWQHPAVSRTVMWASLSFPAYYVALSLWLHFSVSDTKR
jgi:phosphatidylcholine synthase